MRRFGRAFSEPEVYCGCAVRGIRGRIFDRAAVAAPTSTRTPAYEIVTDLCDEHPRLEPCATGRVSGPASDEGDRGERVDVREPAQRPLPTRPAGAALAAEAERRPTVRAALAASGPVGRLRIEPYEKHGERNTVVSGTLTSSAPLERIVMRLAHGDWLFSLHPDDRETTWDVRRTPLGKFSAVVPELLWAHLQRRRDTRAYPYVGPVEVLGSDRPVSKLHRKHRSIADLVKRLRLAERRWSIVDNWDADLCAIGIARADRPRRLIYVSTWKQRRGRFWYECETPKGRDPTDYKVVARGEDVDFATLMRAMEQHLGRKKACARRTRRSQSGRTSSGDA